MQTTQPTHQDLSEILKQKGIRPSYQRIRVLEYFYDHCCHPTAEEIYQALSPEIPTLSLATVYNALHILHANGILRTITIEDEELRYDNILEPHGHFKCSACGRIFNFGINLETIPTEGLLHFQVDEKSVYYKGRCPDCLTKK
jgi:Fe2+ or Zn2+ uptake regulation protein